MAQPVAILRYYDAVVCGADVVDALSHASILRYYGDVVDAIVCRAGAACINLAHYGAVVCGAGAVMRQSCPLR